MGEGVLACLRSLGFFALFIVCVIIYFRSCVYCSNLSSFLILRTLRIRFFDHFGASKFRGEIDLAYFGNCKVFVVLMSYNLGSSFIYLRDITSSIFACLFVVSLTILNCFIFSMLVSDWKTGQRQACTSINL